MDGEKDSSTCLEWNLVAVSIEACFGEVMHMERFLRTQFVFWANA